MSKKRGVVVSTAHQPKNIIKSHSAHHNLQQMGHQPASINNAPITNEPIIAHNMHANIDKLAQSNLLSEDNEKLVNKAYYTYQYPDSQHQEQSDKNEQNDEYVIESMIKRNKIKIQQQKKQKISKNIANQNTQQHKKVSSKPPILSKRQKIPQKSNRQAKISNNRPQITTKPTRQVNLDKFKPKPLNFSQNMLDKCAANSPRKKKANNQEGWQQKINLQRMGNIRINTKDRADAQFLGENINSKRLPFRFNDV